MRQTWRAALIMVAGLAGLAGCSSPPEQASTIPTQQTTASTPATTAAVTSPPGLATTAGPVASTTAVATTESAPASGPVDGLPEPVLTNPTVRWTAARTGLSSAGGGHEFYLRLAADKSGAVLAGVIAGGEQTFVARINAADGTPAWTAPVDGYYQGVLFVAAGLIVFVAPSPIDGAPAVATAFNLDGVSQWSEPLPFSAQDMSASRQPGGDFRPKGGNNQGSIQVSVDWHQIAGWMVIDAQDTLVGVDLHSGATWTYPLNPEIDAITGPAPGDSGPYLHVSAGLDTVIVDGTTGREVARTRTASAGAPFGPHSDQPPYEPTALEATLHAEGDDTIGYFDAGARGVIYVLAGHGTSSAVTVPAAGAAQEASSAVVAVDTASNAILWTFSTSQPYADTSATFDGGLLVNGDDGTVLLSS